mgnify:FL=1
MTVESIPVPDVISALNDPLCAKSPGSDYSSSLSESESAVRSNSSWEWSDLIEHDEQELKVRR